MSLHDINFRRHVASSLYETTPDGLQALILRIAAVRRLREHHVWEAVRLVRELPDLASAEWPSRRFRELMAADALIPRLDVTGGVMFE